MRAVLPQLAYRAYHLADRGTRQLGDAALRAVPGCERRYPGQCQQKGRYALRVQSARGTGDRLDLLRAGRVIRGLVHHGHVGPFDLAAGRAAWVQGSVVHVRGVQTAASATYALPTPPGPNYVPVKVAQTGTRILVELGSTAPGQPSWFYLGTIVSAR